MPPSVRALIVNTKMSNVNAYLTGFVREGFEAVLGAECARVSDYHRCIREAAAYQPDFVLCFDGQEAHRVMLSKLRKLTRAMVLWLTEDPYERSRNAELLPLFDLVFTNDAGSVSYYGDAKVRHLPLAASPRVHDLPIIAHERDYLYDVFFAGVAWPNRARLLRELRPMLDRYRVRTVLPHNEFLRPPNIGVPDFDVNQRISNKDIALLQNRSRVVLYLDRDFSGSGDASRAASPGPRLFETALSGTLQLADASAPGVLDYFEANREIATFSTPEECAAQVEHYVKHPVERRQMASKAQRRARDHHLYRHRAQQIVALVRPLLERRVSAPRVEKSSRPRTVLFVAHNSVDRQPFGGCEVHLDQMLAALPSPCRALGYYPDNAVPGATRLVLARRGIATKKTFTVKSPLDPLGIHDGEREELFARILESERVDIVHFLHLINHPWSLIEVAHRQGSKVVLSVPDHYLVCSRFTLLDADNRFCWSSPPPLASCDVDLERTARLAFGSQARRRALVSHFLTLADALTGLSRSHAQILVEAYPHIADKTDVIPWGGTFEQFARSEKERKRGAPLKVAVVGNFARHKGADALLYVFNLYRRDSRFHFVVLGRVDPPYDTILSELRLPNVEVIGEYKLDKLGEYLGSVHVAIFLSTWAETYVLTLSECWAAGVVPIVSDIGALGERVQDGQNGLKVPPGSAGHVADALDRLATDSSLLAKLSRAATDSRLVTVADTAEAYARLYDRLLEETGSLDAFLGPSEGRQRYAPIPSALPTMLRSWALPTDGAPDVPSERLSRPRPIATAPRRRHPPHPELAQWITEAKIVSETTTDAPEIDGDAMLNGSPLGMPLEVHRDNVRALQLFGRRALFGTWVPVGCSPEGGKRLEGAWIVSDGSDPQLLSPELAFDWADFDGIMVAMAALGPSHVAGAQLFWSGPLCPGFREDVSLRFSVDCDGLVHRYVLRPRWTEASRRFSAVHRLRIDPVDTRGTFYIEKIVLFADVARAHRAQFAEYARVDQGDVDAER